jgi:Ca2+/Na+ antiporter
VIQLLVTACFIPAVIFPFYYVTLRWWETPPGRAVMTMAVALAVVMSLVFMAVVFDFRLPVWARVLIYAVMAVALWVKLAVLVYVSRPGYRPRERQK